MALNREKVIQAAEKYVAKGRVEGAIKEYRKLLEENPNDISTLNRVGDLYARIDRSDEAARLFLQIAQTYTADGFFVKAIAIYKKIIKLDPTRLEIYEKLAELYARQGLVNEARAQYQVLADYYAKHQNAASAIAVHNRMVELEPENPTYHAKLAELYHSQGLIDKAMAEYRIIAELMLKFARPEEASKVYLKALEVSAADLGFVTDAVLALRTAGQNGLAAKLLAAAVEKNPQAERVASITGLRQTGSIPVITPEVEAEAAPAPPSRPPIAAPPPAHRPAPQPAAGAPAAGAPAAGAPAAGAPAAPPSRPTPLPAPPPGSPRPAAPSAAAAPQVAAAPVAPVSAAPPVAASPASVAPPAAPPPEPTPALDEDVFELDLDVEADLAFDLDSVEPARTQIQPPADLEGTGPGRAFAAQAAAEAAEVEWELDLDADVEAMPAAEPSIGEPAPPPAMLGEEWQDVEAAAAEVERGMGTLGPPPVDEEVVEIDLDAYDGVDLEPLALGVVGPSAPPAMFPDLEPPGVEAVTLEELEIEADAEVEPDAEVEAAAAIEAEAAPPFEPPVDGPPPAAAVAAEASEVELELDLEDEVVAADQEEPVVAPTAAPPSVEPPAAPPAEPAAAAPMAVAPPPATAARPAPAAAAEAERRPEDLLAEAEVFAKYGLREKALDRLHQVLAADPENFDAQAQRLLLAADGGDSERVQDLARGVRDLAARKGLGDRWEKVRARLAKQGFQIADAGEVRAAPVKKKPDDRISQLLESLVDVPKRKLTTLPTPAKRTSEEVEDALAGLLGAAKPATGPPPAAEPTARPAASPPSPEPGLAATAAPPPAVAAPTPTPAPRPTPAPMPRPTAAPPPRPVAAPPSPAVAAAPTSELAATAPPSPELPAVAAPPSRFHAELDEELEGFELPRQLAPDELHARQLDDTGNLSWLDESPAPGATETVGDSGGALFDEEEFFDLAAELEEELSDEAAGASDLLVQPQEQSLEEIVEGFKKGVAEHLSAEDYATHYNLGIAYREMGLLDEAIGEFQLAAKDPAHLADCCAMLGLSFVDKGLPELAVKWYKRGLEAPSLSEESTLGLLYDLGDVYMMLGDWDSARKTFVELYGINSNYRDVVAKLAELEPQ